MSVREVTAQYTNIGGTDVISMNNCFLGELETSSTEGNTILVLQMYLRTHDWNLNGTGMHLL